MVDIDLDEWSRRVLWQVCHAGPYLSSILITIDLADLGIINGVYGYEMVEMAMVELNEKGYVVFSQRDHEPEVERHGRMPFIKIKATEDGYIAAGFPPPVRIIGPKHADGNQHPQRPGDPTDWRNHGYHAVAVGKIERMPLRDHIYAYWDHAECHFEALWEIEARKEGSA